VVPLVYWMLIAVVELERGGAGAQVVLRDRVAGGQQLVPLGGVEEDRALQLRQLVAHSRDHRAVVGGLELRRGDQQAAAGVAQRVTAARTSGTPG